MHRKHRLVRALAPFVAAAAIGCAHSHGPGDPASTARSAPHPTARSNGSSQSTTQEEAQQEAQRRARANYQLGVNYLKSGNAPQAVAALLEARRWDPQSERTELALSEAYRQQGRNKEAEQHLLRALEIKPQFHEGLLNLAALYIQMERYEEALPVLHRLLDDATAPAPWRALTNLGWAEYRLGRVDDAYQHLSLAVDNRPDYWPARLDLGILEAERGNRSEAIAQFQHVLEANPGPLAEAEVRFRLAEQLLQQGDRQGARRQLTTASGLEPSGPWSKRSAETLKTLE
jgi:Tfp pilus assembly protein PilF